MRHIMQAHEAMSWLMILLKTYKQKDLSSEGLRVVEDCEKLYAEVILDTCM